MPQKQPKSERLWPSNGLCVRFWPLHKDYVWSYDFVVDHASDGRAFRIRTTIAEYSCECLAIDVVSRLTSEDVLERLSDLFVG